MVIRAYRVNMPGVLMNKVEFINVRLVNVFFVHIPDDNTD